MFDALDLRVGDTVATWRLEKRLGRGSFGEVWAVSKDLKPSRRRALKLIPLDTDAVLEAKVLNSLHHPHLVYVNDRFDSSRGAPPGFAAIVMTLGDQTLADAFESPGGVDTETIRRSAMHITCGLDFLHRGRCHEGRRIIHGDIKPENVILVGDRWQLADFGIATFTETTGETIRGLTRAFAPPEYLVAAELGLPTNATAAGDIWSLGTSLIDALRVSVDSKDSPAYETLAFVVSQCLSEMPRDRPTARELYALLDGIPRPAPPSPTAVLRQAVAASGGSAAALPGAGFCRELDKWTSRETRREFLFNGIHKLTAEGDVGAVRGLLEIADYFVRLPKPDLIPGADLQLSSADVWELRQHAAQ